MSDTNGTQTSDQPIFSVEKLYVRDLSIEVPNAPQCFLERETPNIDVQLATAATRLDEGFFDVVGVGQLSAEELQRRERSIRRRHARGIGEEGGRR